MNNTLVARLATVPGPIRPGISHWDLRTRLPLHPLSVENAYGNPRLLHDLAVPGADSATQLGVLDPAVHRLAVDALTNHWTDDDPRWALLDSGHRAAA